MTYSQVHHLDHPGRDALQDRRMAVIQSDIQRMWREVGKDIRGEPLETIDERFWRPRSPCCESICGVLMSTGDDIAEEAEDAVNGGK